MDNLDICDEGTDGFDKTENNYINIKHTAQI